MRTSSASCSRAVCCCFAGRGQDAPGVSLGLKAIEAGYRVLFTTAASLIEKLTKAHAEGRLEDKLKVYTAPRLLIIDEIGYLPIDRVGANLFFQLISRRYERGPMILTSNQSFGAWGEVFGDRIIATAILDRLLHHAVTMNIRGNSYRLKDKLKAGLVRSHDDNASQPGGKFERPRLGRIRRPLTRKHVNVTRQMLRYWSTCVMRSKVQPMKEVAELVRRHIDGIVAWAQTRQTNGFLEAINGLFQAAKRRARGFVRLSTIKTVIFLIAGKLDFHAINPHAPQPT